MVINFRVHKISRGTYKLVWTFILKKYLLVVQSGWEKKKKFSNAIGGPDLLEVWTNKLEIQAKKYLVSP